MSNKVMIVQHACSDFIFYNVLKFRSYRFFVAYIIRWSFQIMRTGIRNIKGGKSKKEDIGRDSVLFFYWQGQDCSTSDKGTAALVTSEIDKNEGPSVSISI